MSCEGLAIAKNDLGRAHSGVVEAVDGNDDAKVARDDAGDRVCP